MILKLKRKANLKELEKHLIKLNIIENNKCIHKNVYCCVEEKEKIYIKNNNIQNCFVQFFINRKREIDHCNYPEERNEEVINIKIFDLTKADLLEKIEENRNEIVRY